MINKFLFKSAVVACLTATFGGCAVSGGSNDDKENYEETSRTETERQLLPSASITKVIERVQVVEQPAKEIEKFTLSASDNFEFDKAVLSSNGKRQLRQAIEKFNLANVTNINITGHTDSIGSDEYNYNLSLRRADAVKDYLVTQGVDNSIIKTEGMGESQPIASNETDEGRAENRRVEIQFNAERS